MMLVVDASVVVSALIGVDDEAEWACSTLLDGPLCAPHLMPVEVASVLRRAAAAGDISPDAASLAYADMLDLRVDLYPFAPLAVRIWEMRDTCTLLRRPLRGGCPNCSMRRSSRWTAGSGTRRVCGANSARRQRSWQARPPGSTAGTGRHSPDRPSPSPASAMGSWRQRRRPASP